MPKTGKSKQPAQARTRRDCYYQQLLHQARCQKNIAVRPEELAWFDIGHYQYVRHLTLRELMTELVVRGSLCTAPDIVTRDGTVLGPGEVFQTCYPKIIAGEPELHKLFISHEKIPELNYLRSTEDVCPQALELPVRELSIGDIDTCYHALSAAETAGTTFSMETSRHPCYLGYVRKSEIEPETRLTRLQTQTFGSYIEQIYLAVDPSFSKSQLIDAFSELLTDLDNQYGLFTPSADRHGGLGKKLLYDIQACHLIPLIDLLLWQIRNGKVLPLRVIGNLLEKHSFDASSASTGYSQTNFRNRYLRTFNQVMNQGNPGEILNRLLENTDDYDASYYDTTHA